MHPYSRLEGTPILGVKKPKTIQEASSILQELFHEKEASFPKGGGTKLTYGSPPARPGYFFDTSLLATVKEYPNEDLTITVEAGISTQMLQDVLQKKGQMLPIDSMCVPGATLGGLIATDSSGPRSYGYGTLRDYLIGIDILTPEGTKIHGGGKVVKNVAGYDLMKLHTGAFGTLGIIVEVSLKLKPIPESVGALVFALSLSEIEPVLDVLNRSITRPVAIEVVDAATNSLVFEKEGDDFWKLLVFFEENQAAVDWQINTLQEEFSSYQLKSIRSSETYHSLLQTIAKWPLEAEANLIFTVSVPPSEIVAFCTFAKSQSEPIQLLCSAGSGLIWGGISIETKEEAQDLTQTLLKFSNSLGGNLIVYRCPHEWKGFLPIWGNPRQDLWLMKKLKQKLDPENLLNPGRFVVDRF